ncbi:MAG: phage portal protein, partial [Methylobacteriaceae bacterium]|nr:phage portal protein [Methylobacteriaceae bacterium]
MPKLLTRLLGRAAERKAAPPLPTGLTLYLGGRPGWTERDGAALAREGFLRNAIVHRSVKLLAESAASLPLVLTQDGRAADDHPIATLLARPNGTQAGTGFLERVYAHLALSGNAYLEAALVEGVPRALYALRPDRMRVVPGPDGWPVAFDYAVGSRTLRYPVPADGGAPILPLAECHPLDDHYGLGATSAAAAALDIHNAASTWNKSLLDNAARPSGALVLGSSAAAPMADAQFDRLKAELAQTYQGAAHAGRPMLLEGGLDWKPFSLSPRDMDFVEAKNAAAREIALAFGVPPLLLGLAGDNTHANYAEANRAFYRQSVIPLARRTAEALVAWLGPAFPGRLRL